LSVYDDDNTVYINKVTEKEKCILKLMWAAWEITDIDMRGYS
jgi:hypothetical protein